MGPRLARHLLPAQATILGVRLQAFSLWHGARLDALGSPFLDCGLPIADCGLAELALAVRVCEMRANSERVDLRLSFSTRFWLRLCRLVYRGEQLEEQVDAFFEYLRGAQNGPRQLDANTTGKKRGAYVQSDSWVYLATGLMEMGFTKGEAWAESPGMARFYLTARDERRDRKVSIWNRHQLRLRWKAVGTNAEKAARLAAIEEDF